MTLATQPEKASQGAARTKGAGKFSTTLPRHPKVALLGNPNTGKSTIFNRLTGLQQQIANYPGVTVQKKTGRMMVGDEAVELIDLPGAYSLAASSPDERVVQWTLEATGPEKIDLLVCILDATNLKRNLLLVSQAAELGIPMVVALNQWDVAQRNGLTIDVKLLENRLGVPVIPTVGRKGTGLPELKNAIATALQDPRYFPRMVWPDFIEKACEMVTNGVVAAGRSLTKADALRIIFDTDSAFAKALDLPLHLPKLQRAAREMIRANYMNPASAEAVLHYKHIEALLDGVVAGDGFVARSKDSIDTLLLNRFWGSVIFIGVMFIVFQSLYAWAGPVMDLIDAGTGWVQELVAPALASLPTFQSLVVDGIIGGVGGVLIFLPQILLLFFFIALLEDSGYLARAAFLMDKLLGWCGLNGKSFVPMLSGYACAIPGVLAARTLEDPKARITTILLIPFMSCSARLPVYVLLIGAFIEPVYGSFVAGWVLLLMHFVGAMVAMPLAWLLNRVILRTKAQPFILEMPSYRIPTLRNVMTRMWEAGSEFLVRAGTVILAFSVIIWALLYFPRPESVAENASAAILAEAAQEMSAGQIEEALADPESDLARQIENRIAGAYIEQSYLGRFGKWVQPIFAPAGFDWKITVGVLSSFPAREVIIATMGIIYNLGGEVDEESGDLRRALERQVWETGPLAGTPVFTIPVVFGVMVFFALCLQCGATVAVIARELNWWWASGAFVFMTALGWLAAVVIYQVGSRWPL